MNGQPGKIHNPDPHLTNTGQGQVIPLRIQLFGEGSHRKTPWALLFVSRLILGGVFLYAGLEKILHPAAFADTIFNYRILPEILTPFAAVVLPWLEVFVGLALFLGVWLPGAVFLCNLLLVIFLGALVFNLSRGLNVHCGCFGTTSREGSHEPMVWYLARDAVFFIPAFYLFMHTFIIKK